MRPPKLIKPYVETFVRHVVGGTDADPFYVGGFNSEVQHFQLIY